MNTLKKCASNNRLLRGYAQMSVVSKATLWFLFCSIVQKGFSLLTTPIFTRLLTKSQYGLYSVYLSWLQILTILVTFRLDFSVFNKGMAKYPEDRDGYASAMLGLTTLLTTVLMVAYLLFREPINAFTEISTPVMLGMIAELYVVPAVSFWSLRERYDFHYKNVCAVTLLTAVLNTALGVAAVLVFEDKGTARVLSCVVAQLIVGVFIFVHLFRKGKKFWDKKYIRFAIRFNIPLIPYYFSTYIVEQSDRIMIQKLVSMEAVAPYNVAYTVGGIIKIVSNSLNNALIPLIYRQLGDGQLNKVKKQLIQVMIGAVGVIAVFTCLAPEVIWVFGGKSYYEAIYVIPPVAASVFFSLLFSLLGVIEFYYDCNVFATLISLISAALNIGLNLLFIPRIGYVAAAYTTLVSFVFSAVTHLFYVNHVTRQKTDKTVVDVSKMLVLSTCTIVFSIGISLIYAHMMIRYLLVAAACIAVLVKRRELMAMLKTMRKKD